MEKRRDDAQEEDREEREVREQKAEKIAKYAQVKAKKDPCNLTRVIRGVLHGNITVKPVPKQQVGENMR